MTVVFTLTENSLTYHSDNNANQELRQIAQIPTTTPLVLLSKMINDLNIQVISAVVSIIGVDLDANKN